MLVRTQWEKYGDFFEKNVEILATWKPKNTYFNELAKFRQGKKKKKNAVGSVVVGD